VGSFASATPSAGSMIEGFSKDHAKAEWSAMDRMGESLAKQLREKVDEIYRSASRRVFATLIRLLGDFDLAEEALERWTRSEVPANPGFGSSRPSASRRSTTCAAPASTRRSRSSPTARTNRRNISNSAHPLSIRGLTG
jgi:hypothetical protein